LLTWRTPRAAQNAPETVVGQVIMLYMPAEANGVALQAFVDSGAQMTIMSTACARRCGILRLVDERFAGMAVGVGTQRIVGRVHAVPIKLGGAYLPCSVSVLEKDDEPSFIFGLDMLKRHQCVIDLGANCLTVGTTGERVPFLSEGDLPRGKGTFGGEEREEPGGPSAVPPAPSAAAASGGGGGGAPAAAAAPPAPAAPQAAAAVGGSGGADAVGKLVELGFTAAAAAEALAACDGNAEQAAALLFSGGF
jgi:DNA damage-inducible protein 1